MFIDPITVQYPEALEKDRFVIATYYCATKATTNSLKFAVALAIEQTCGTWLKVPGETQEVRERSIGRVVGVYETPSYQMVFHPILIKDILSLELLFLQRILDHLLQ